MSAALLQPGDTGTAAGGRSLGRWRRLWTFFRGSLHALSCIPFRCGHERSENTLNGSDVQTGGDSEGGGNAILTTTPNNSGTLAPPSSGSLDASGPRSSSPRKDRLWGTTNNGADKGEVNIEKSDVTTHEQGTPGQPPSAVPDLPMSTSHPVPLSSKSALPSSGTSAERASSTHALSIEPDETDRDDADVNHGVGMSHDTADYEAPQNVSEGGEDDNGPPSRKTTATSTSSFTGGNPEDGGM